MSPRDGSHVIPTPIFLDDCKCHNFPTQSIEDVKTILLLNPTQGKKILFAKGDQRRMKCGELRILSWMFERNGLLAKGHILYLHIPDILPIYLLRLEIDDARDHGGPFNNPKSWPKWAELSGELVEIILRHLV